MSNTIKDTYCLFTEEAHITLKDGARKLSISLIIDEILNIGIYTINKTVCYINKTPFTTSQRFLVDLQDKSIVGDKPRRAVLIRLALEAFDREVDHYAKLQETGDL